MGGWAVGPFARWPVGLLAGWPVGRLARGPVSPFARWPVGPWAGLAGWPVYPVADNLYLESCILYPETRHLTPAYGPVGPFARILTPDTCLRDRSQEGKAPNSYT
ncbi:hypothetical protein D3OALGA1CA_3102 [Olavius algarvensis associated proteobacterium Delta 3]|nr:hypothetical protein D3OALGA1CA_3102 [Olavius algarvensis associated proteobacterium Delta 3]